MGWCQLLVSVPVVLSLAAGPPPEESRAAAQTAVDAWLAAVDQGDFGKSWEMLAKLTRDKVSKNQWIELMKGTLGPLGSIRNRKFVTSIPLKPQAKAVGIEGLDLIYESSFSERPFGLDDFGVVREADGQWRVALYRSSFRPGHPMAFSVPAAPWLMEFPFAGVEINQQSVKPDGRSGYFQIAYTDTKMIVSFWIEPAAKCQDSQSCRDMVYAGNTPKLDQPRNLSKGQVGDISVFEYLLPTFRGIELNQHNFYAEFVANGWWVDMHASKSDYKADDHRLFEDLVKVVRFEPKRQDNETK
jgi:hypothetical protein